MPGTSPSFLGDMMAERAAKDRAVDDLGMLQMLAEGQVRDLLDYYGTAARRAVEVDDRDQVERVLRSMGRDMEAVERLREHLLMTERGVRDTAELVRVQHLKAELERLKRKLRKVSGQLRSDRRTFFLTMKNMRGSKAKPRPASEKDKPGAKNDEGPVVPAPKQAPVEESKKKKG